MIALHFGLFSKNNFLYSYPNNTVIIVINPINGLSLKVVDDAIYIFLNVKAAINSPFAPLPTTNKILW